MLGRKRKSRNSFTKTPTNRKPSVLRRTVFFLKTFFVTGMFMVMSFFFIISYDLLVQLDSLNATSISVKGNVQLSEEQVVEYSKLHIGENILSMNLSAAKKRLLSHPIISGVAIARNFPSGITIDIKEHVPIAILDIGRPFVINAHGEIFIEASASDMKDIPLIVGFTPSDLNADGEIHTQPFNEVLNLLQLGLMPNSLLPADKIKRIRVDKQTGLTVNTSGRIKIIKLGYGNYYKKIEQLKTIFNFLNDRQDLKKFVSVDLNNLKRIVLKPS